jgi:hypothetical protein
MGVTLPRACPVLVEQRAGQAQPIMRRRRPVGTAARIDLEDELGRCGAFVCTATRPPAVVRVRRPNGGSTKLAGRLDCPACGRSHSARVDTWYSPWSRERAAAAIGVAKGSGTVRRALRDAIGCGSIARVGNGYNARYRPAEGRVSGAELSGLGAPDVVSALR